MFAAPSLRAAPRLVLFVALVAALLVALPASESRAAAPDPREDHPWIPKKCVRAPGDYVPYQAGPCYLTKFRKHRPTVVMWGDSHAWQHIPAARPLARKKRVNLVMFMLGGCPPILVREGIRRDLPACEKSNQMALRFVRDLKRRKKPVRVLLGAAWDGYYSVYRGLYVTKTIDKSDYSKTQRRSTRTFHRLTPKLFDKLGALNVRVDVIGQAATVPRNPPTCLFRDDPYQCKLRRTTALPREQRWIRWFRQEMRPLPRHSRLVRFNHTYCDSNWCYGKRRGIYTFWDATHLSATRTATFKRFFAASFRFR